MGFGTHLRSRAERESQALSLSALLNAIDGVAAPEGHILIMTTNHPEHLDPALIRPGRVDMQVAFGYANKKDSRELFCTIYGISNDKSCLALSEEFASSIPEGKISAAAIQGYLLQHTKSPEDAVRDVRDWVRTHLEESNKVQE